MIDKAGPEYFGIETWITIRRYQNYIIEIQVLTQIGCFHYYTPIMSGLIFHLSDLADGLLMDGLPSICL